MLSSVVEVLLGVVTVVVGGVGVGVPTSITALIAGNIMSLVTDGSMFVPLECFTLIVFSAFVRNKRKPCLNTF